MIPVTKPYFPNRKKLDAYIDQIYESEWLTNNGPLVQKLEKRLQEHLGVKHLILVANGTIALQVAYKALNLTGEVITTPFSFAATTSSLVWDGLEPVFADIHPKTLNIDPENIEKLITNKTTAILPVHVFGNPCEVEKIEAIAKKHNLKVIYDAAHAFNVKYKGQSILNSGDVSTLSFHATKLFHTGEGGAIVTNDDELAKKIRLLINFGITGPETIESIGINAKMNELSAAMGLAVLDDIDQIVGARKDIWAHYQQELSEKVSFQEFNINAENNYAYVPILLESEAALKSIQLKLNQNNIFPRRYFYPSLDTLSYIKSTKKNLISDKISKKILCLPIYQQLPIKQLEQIISILIRQ